MAEPQPKSMVLRFRDLATAPGETIATHRALIEEQGHVWWGWWSKPGETIPDQVFRRFKIQAQSQGLDVYLMDSGQGRLYGAHCTDIEWSGDHKRMSSPGETPNYYKTKEYRAWFQFSGIERDPIEECDLRATTPVEQSLLRDFTYVRVDGFFQEAISSYGPFYGKRIHSIRELVQQNRTIWFFRDFSADDPLHEISLTDSDRIEPHDFSNAFRQSASLDMLWVSDLHFSVDGEHHGFPQTSSATDHNLLGRVIQTLEGIGVNTLAGVLVSGDFTWKANPDEYGRAADFLWGVQSWAKLKAYDLLFCPGNHDVAFSANPASKDEPVAVAPRAARATYDEFYQRFFYKQANQYLSSGRQFLIGGAIPVEIVSLNSSLLEQKPGIFQGHGYLGDPQLNHAATQMGWDEAEDRPRNFRIAMIHHHLIPVTYREEAVDGRLYSVVLDAEALARWIVKHRVNLMLHGHMHEPFYVRMSRPVDPNQPDEAFHTFYVVGMGSTGVEQSHLGHIISKNVLGLLHFREDHLEVILYSFSPVAPAQLHWKIRVPYRIES